MASKLKKLKLKTHKASVKRFKISGTGKVMHRPQGAGNGHSMTYKNRRQKSAAKGTHALRAGGEQRKIKRLLLK